MPRKPDLPLTTLRDLHSRGRAQFPDGPRQGPNPPRPTRRRWGMSGPPPMNWDTACARSGAMLRRAAARWGGILTGLISAQAESVLFLSCDMPFVTPELLRELIAALDQTKPASRSTSLRSPRLCGVFARSGDTVGFPLVIRREVREVVEELIATNAGSLQGFARRVNARSHRIPAARSLELANINTPDDLKRETEKTE